MNPLMKPRPEVLPQSLVGLLEEPVQAIDTPALVVDLDAMNRNVQRMAEFCTKHRVRLRPHAKAHKSGAIARVQAQAGSVGVCVQTLAEAEILAANGVRDLFITNLVVATDKLLRVAALAQALKPLGGRLALAVDSAQGVEWLAQAMKRTDAIVDVFIEIDVGQGRCGVAPGEAAVALARQIDGYGRWLRFAGLQAYHGGLQHRRAAAERRDGVAEVSAQVQRTRDALEAAGIAVPLVTGGGTGTCGPEALSGTYGELQPGSYLFMDADYARNERDGAQPEFEHALFVKSQVISTSATHVVIDAGHKSHALDSGPPTVLDWPLEYFNGGDEHGILRLAPDAPAGSQLPKLGDTLWLIPGHCDPTVNLHDHMIGIRGGLQNGTVQHLIRVDARGVLA